MPKQIKLQQGHTTLQLWDFRNFSSGQVKNKTMLQARSAEKKARNLKHQAHKKKLVIPLKA